jgi:hypothetical protein
MAISVNLPTLNFIPFGSLVQEEYAIHQEGQFQILGTTWNTAMATFKTELNSTESAINAKELSCNNLFNLTSQYKLATEQLKNDALAYKNASETAYQNTVTLIQNTDISGTAGYTIEAVDDLMSRTRNLQFVGLN